MLGTLRRLRTAWKDRQRRRAIDAYQSGGMSMPGGGPQGNPTDPASINAGGGAAGGGGSAGG